MSQRSQSRTAADAASWLAVAFAVAVGLITAVPAIAIDCSNTPSEPPFKEPPVIEALCNGKPCLPGQPGAINTTFRLEIKEQCVPGSTTPMQLRTYVYPDPKNPNNWLYGFPGPTLKLRKAFKPGDKGDTVGILLVNNLPPDSPTTCNSACPATSSDGKPFVCPDRSKLPTPPSEKCGGSDPDPLCCCWVNVNQHHPDCMHGDNTTNLHLHGSHISPQSPQDYVLLELHPGGDKGKKLHAMTARSDLEVSQFQYQTDPFPYTQAEGTHWYHPHKHGSVSLQVANGMPGAMIILGPFDQWLDEWYAKRGIKLTEKLFVAQQIQESSNLFGKGGAPSVLINGLLNPKLTVQAGEVQRWRVVNATMQTSGQLNITFPAGAQVKQIAQDGVQFARGTYDKQPLLTNGQFSLSPGNRADFLVWMPATATKVRATARVFGKLSTRARQKIQLREQIVKALAASNEAEAPVFTLEVVAPPNGAPVVKENGFPSVADWPEMPWYLKDIQPSEVKGKQDLTFSMASITTGKPTAGAGGDPSTVFLINDRQYDPDCVNVTTKLGTADEWHIENSSGLAHPFHIHTNPFQLVELGAMINGQPVPSTKYDPPIWHDTIALPTPTAKDVDAGPIWNNDDAKAKCPGVCQKTQGVWNGNWKTTVPNQMSVCGCDYNGYVKLLHRYLDFTGEYVLHCHFLGHEDRGMMFGVQTVCEQDPTKFGKAKADGSPECVPGNLVPATKQCPATPTKPMAAEPHQHP